MKIKAGAAQLSIQWVNAAEDLTQRLADLEMRLKQCQDAAAVLEAEKAGRLKADAAAPEPANNDVK